jgi:hypothetical protein
VINLDYSKTTNIKEGPLLALLLCLLGCPAQSSRKCYFFLAVPYGLLFVGFKLTPISDALLWTEDGDLPNL